MRIALFGGTGRVGARFLALALARGHAVRALARDPARLAPRAGLEVEPGDALDAAAVARVVAGCDAVVSTLGGRSGTARSEGMRNIAAAMRAAGVARVVALAGGGILDAPGGGLRRDQPGYPPMFRAVSEEHLGVWEALRGTALAWTVFCPPDIPDRDGTGSWRTAVDVMPDGPGREIPAGDLVEAMLDAVVRGSFAGSRVGIKS